MIAFGGNNTSGEIDVASARSSRANRFDFDTDTFLVAAPVRASDGHHGHSSGRGDGTDNLLVEDVYALRSDASRDGEARTPSADAEGKVRLRDPGFNVYRESPTLDGTAPHSVAYSGGVRRLTPLECERLMGFPDDHTRYGADGREIPDSHRYRMCGNGVVAPVAEWLGHRLAWVDANRKVR